MPRATNPRIALKLLNEPHREEEYREFRRRILHLASLDLARELSFEPIRFMDGSQEVIGRSVISNYNWDEVQDIQA